MRILITAGPTREYLDDVRFLSNASSGRMGYALAEAVRDAGHVAVLLSGPVALSAPEGVEFHAAETSQQMYERALKLFEECQGVIGAAAVCDYRPKSRAAGKLSKTGRPLQLELVETEDVLAELGRRKGTRWVVGFALEAANGRIHARDKLRRKSCDAIVLNHPAAIGAETNQVELIDFEGKSVATWGGTKPDIARRMVEWITTNLARRGDNPTAPGPR